ncbi:Histone deacetylase complex subunit SAP18, partial [Armadillidium vulgare]
ISKFILNTMEREGSIGSSKSGKLTILKTKMKIKLRKEDKITLLLVFTEVIIIGVLMALNYILRFDDTIRESSDMISLEYVLLTCDESVLRYQLSRPFYDYGVGTDKSIDGLELTYELPEWAFFLAALLAPIGIICVFETANYYIKIHLMERKGISAEKSQGFPKPIRRITRFVGGYLLGGSIAGIFTSVMKLNIVSPRPNFMSICFPGETVQDYSFCSSDNYWNPTKVCDNKDEKELSEGLKSFPSYHATIATYGLATGYSFPSDIVGGIIIGFFAAYYISDNDSDSSLESEGQTDFERWATKIDSHKYIPRIQSEVASSSSKSELYPTQIQAVNPTMKPDDRFPTPPPLPPVAKRSQSSVSRNGESSNLKENYDVPRQRQSAPVPKVQENKRDGYTNYGYSNNEPKMTFSAYKGSGANEDLSRF